MYNELEKIRADVNKPHHLKYLKGCLPHILLGPFWNYLDPFLGPLWPLLLQLMANTKLATKTDIPCF